MPVYRIYFRSDGAIVGRDDFDAENDDAAIFMAELLYDACSDCCDEFDLWQGPRQIGLSSFPPRDPDFEITPHIWETLRQRQQAIRNSHWSIAKSKRLAGRIGDSERERDTPQARRWQMKAEELRTLAEQTTNPSARKSLLRVAATYATLAEHEPRQATGQERADAHERTG